MSTATSTLPTGHRIASDTEPGWFYHGLWITDAAAPTYTSFPCPDCGTLVLFEGKDIHHCTTKIKIGRKIHTDREYVGYYDAYRVCGMADCHAVEVELDRYAMELIGSGSTRSATDLDAGLPPWEAVEIVEPEPPVDDGPDDNWGGFRTECAHCLTIQRCHDDGEAYICLDRAACQARAARFYIGPDAAPAASTADLAGGHDAPPPPRCKACGGAHDIQRCPQVGALLLGNPHIFEVLPALRRECRAALEAGHNVQANAAMIEGACRAELYVSAVDMPVVVEA